VRYRGQSFELTVAADDVDALAHRFAAAHRRRYGFDLDGEAVEIVSIRLTATVPVRGSAFAAAPDGRPAQRRRRAACFDGVWHDTPVHADVELAVGDSFAGPAIVEFAESTCVVRPGWSATVDDAGALVLERA
jgi:N-methylhydantoinase A